MSNDSNGFTIPHLIAIGILDNKERVYLGDFLHAFSVRTLQYVLGDKGSLILLKKQEKKDDNKIRHPR